ncbi:class III lanthionine synthetase LanKC [Kribbella deserti]|uniref:non-specific serine/threonine protein kinase n=1 Tax=Kribbella deserti TaxID=1926257 RepID=A0ABV6QQW4_9ACTN
MAQYELYCLADRRFYDSPVNRGAEHPDFPQSTLPVPAGWEHHAGEVWMNYAPAGLELPPQGWKIHVSSCLADAERTLAVVWDYCVPRGIAFKFLRNEPVMVMLNSKSAARGSSGKLVTIYPADEAQLELVLKELDDLLDGIDGPYILSDLRFGKGPLFVRYGGFATRYCLNDTGERVLALEDSEGRLVPDVRGPIFAVPAWVSLPSFLEPHLEARNSVTTNELAYAIESVIQFSNGGGVYLGHHLESKERVVLKEGRPLAGLDVASRDAVARIAHERDMLERLAGLDVVPALHDYFTLGDHHFLVQEFVDANPLQRLIVNKYPLTRPDVTDEERAEYVDWALGMIGQVTRAVGALHERGVVFNDLHPDNVLIGHGDRMVLIDFEVATLVTERARSVLAHPGYAAPGDRQGVDVDRYALACLVLGMFAPQTTMLLQLNPAKAHHLADLITEAFPVPRATIDQAVQTIAGHVPAEPMPELTDWPVVRTAIAKAIVASATPEREDRLFPGDIAQFEPGGGINLSYGAAGVLYALARTGAGQFPEYEEWLWQRTLASIEVGPGLYDGLHGVAYVLDQLGHRERALALVGHCLEPQTELELGLHSGLAGIGLNLLHFAGDTGEAAALRVLDQVADRLGGPDDVPELSGEGNPRAGLLFGSSGPALLFIHAYERLGDSGLLDLAKIALQQDLRRCTTDAAGMLQVNQGWRLLPYLEEGSAGISLVIDQYLRHRADDELAAARDALRKVTHSEFFVQPGLFMGRAGILLAATDQQAKDQLVRGLGWHAMPADAGLTFPGNQLLRLSMDLATGSAGVLLAMGSALHPQPVGLPYLGSPQRSEPKKESKEV